MSLFDRVRKEIPAGTVFLTPVKRCRNRIDYENDNVVFFKDTNKKPFSKTPRVCWDGIPEFLKNKGWVKIGANYGTAQQGSLQEYIDRFHSQGKTHSSEANDIASILERLGIIEIDRNRPAKIRLL
jgi:hypothetical protein